ncbi:MAG: NAD-dependent epimerase/dehydratase family protein [Spirochaetales bacterium]|nr:NAD-dependent epimerase/dehydratase family protein [Spirochaetales bacterium]
MKNSIEVAVVTGAAGHVGANLVRYLASQKLQVRACVFRDRRALTGLENNNFVTIVQADVTEFETLKTAFENADTVFHCAGFIAIADRQYSLMKKINVHGTANVVEAAKATGVKRVIHFSSIHALQDTRHGEPVTEQQPLVEDDRGMKYDFTKAEGERIVLSAVEKKLDAVIVNPTGIIGPHDYKPSFLGQFILAVMNKKIPMLVKGGFNWVDVRDVCCGALQAALYGKTGERYILGNRYESVHDLAVKIASVAGVSPPQCSVPHWLAHIGVPFFRISAKVKGASPLFTHQSLRTLLHHKNISYKKAGDELHWKPGNLDETIRDTVVWFQNNGFV